MPPVVACELTILGIRHHGPGCARAVLAALEAMRPDVLLVEGPADGQAALAALATEGFQPPVALLVYQPDAPERAAFYPFAAFSPEWNALRWAAANGVPARLIDLPHGFPAPLPGRVRGAAGEGEDGERVPDSEADLPQWARIDPIGALAEAAGHDDPELWWEQQVEQRQDATAMFEAIAEAMAALRRAFPDDPPHERCREAHMRQAIRAAAKAGYRRAAVVCGAWHAPALSDALTAEPAESARDAALLADQPVCATSATWIPWSHARLARASGYGAGVKSPGWYDHLWHSPAQAAVRWVASAARLLRAEGLDASPASVVEAVRLAEAIAAVRGRPSVGLDALMEAIEAVLCGGRPERLAVVRERLEVGDATGAVPDTIPLAPLARDLQAQQKRLRLKPEPTQRTLALDLREPTDRERSALLHRLRLLGVPWGRIAPRRGATGTFHEDWELVWAPEFELDLIAKSALGLTIADAARAWIRQEAQVAPFPQLTALLDAAVLAGLPEALPALLARIADAAALTPDVGAMMEGLPPLARVVRYGDVRGTSAAQVLPIARGLAERVAVGLPGACASLDDEAAQAMDRRLGLVADALALLRLDDVTPAWEQALLALADGQAVHGRVRGAALRLLADRGTLAADELARRVGLALGPACLGPPIPGYAGASGTMTAAAWIEGLVGGAATVLLQLEGVWRALDRWLQGLPDDDFMLALPLLRRAFARFDGAERRAMTDKVRALPTGGAAHAAVAADDDLDADRTAEVVPVIIHVMGGNPAWRSNG